MKPRKYLTIAVAALLLIGGAAAIGAASPAEQTPDQSTVVSGESTTNDAIATQLNIDERPGDSDRIGPSEGLPDKVPDHVSEIHQRIASHLDGSLDSLGDSLSELLGVNDDASDATDRDIGSDE